MNVHVVVADQSEARFYAVEHAVGPLQLTARLTDPKAHLHDRDFNSDRPGRAFDHGPIGTGRRGASGHHGTEGERRPREHEALLFARQIAAALEQSQRDVHIDRLILIAGPHFLGVLRQVLSPAVRAIVSEEIPKDLVHEPESAVLSHLSPESFHRQPL
ncbi:MAG: host attachment protein [Steroidobacteraceae bacterium]